MYTIASIKLQALDIVSMGAKITPFVHKLALAGTFATDKFVRVAREDFEAMMRELASIESPLAARVAASFDSIR